MRFFVDECISPSLVRALNDLGYDAVHPRDRGRLGESDRAVFARAIAEDRIVVTENAADFRELAAGVDLHPGLIVLPSVGKGEAQRLMELAVAELVARGGDRPGDPLVNAVLTIDRAGEVHVEPVP